MCSLAGAAGLISQLSLAIPQQCTVAMVKPDTHCPCSAKAKTFSPRPRLYVVAVHVCSVHITVSHDNLPVLVSQCFRRLACELDVACKIS